MPRYRKKPVEIEAVQWTGNNYVEVGSLVELSDWDGHSVSIGNDGLVIHTREGDMRADPGDWVIRGVAGELYPCKPEIFEQTYEPVV